MYTGFKSGVWELYNQGICGLDPRASTGEKETAKNFMRERYIYGMYSKMI